MQNEEKLTMSIKEAAEWSGIGVRRLRELVKEPDCSFVLKIGNRTRIKTEQFKKYIHDVASV